MGGVLHGPRRSKGMATHRYSGGGMGHFWPRACYHCCFISPLCTALCGRCHQSVPDHLHALVCQRSESLPLLLSSSLPPFLSSCHCVRSRSILSPEWVEKDEKVGRVVCGSSRASLICWRAAGPDAGEICGQKVGTRPRLRRLQKTDAASRVVAIHGAQA